MGRRINPLPNHTVFLYDINCEVSIKGDCMMNTIVNENLISFKELEIKRLRKFTFGFNGVEFTHDALIKYQAMTCGFNIPLFGILSKPSFLSGQTPAYSSWLCF